MGKIEDDIQQKEFKDPYNKVIVNLLYTQSYIVSSQKVLFKPYGISPEQYNVLRILRGQNGAPTTVSSIQQRMLNKMSNASRLVDKLKSKGLVLRNECPNDRRQVDILITDQGLKVLDELQLKVETENRNFVKLDVEEVQQLNHLLNKMRG
jgi:DNA-binding MarR family transcriptional regulator